MEASPGGSGTISEFENSGWDEISSAYELYFGPLTRQSTSVVMDSARVRPGIRFLDVMNLQPLDDATLGKVGERLYQMADEARK